MAIPVSYNLRNLVVRWVTTIVTALGIALTVAVLLAVLALVNGLKSAFQSTGNPQNLIVTRKGATSELTSGMSRTAYQVLKAKAGVAEMSLELVTVINLPTAGSNTGFNVN